MYFWQTAYLILAVLLSLSPFVALACTAGWYLQHHIRFI